jgi:hypothetical protein
MLRLFIYGYFEVDAKPMAGFCLYVLVYGAVVEIHYLFKIMVNRSQFTGRGFPGVRCLFIWQ